MKTRAQHKICFITWEYLLLDKDGIVVAGTCRCGQRRFTRHLGGRSGKLCDQLLVEQSAVDPNNQLFQNNAPMGMHSAIKKWSSTKVATCRGTHSQRVERTRVSRVTRPTRWWSRPNRLFVGEYSPPEMRICMCVSFKESNKRKMLSNHWEGDLSTECDGG